MDSWTPAQMEIMKLGGNQKCQSYLKEKGNIAQNVPIKQKYESDVAQLYKLILKARAEGKFLL
jgi:ADP-ribosylation factor GTPase-activating protein 1